MFIQTIRANPYGWLVVAVCFLSLMASYAARSSIGLMMPLWERDPGWTRDLASGAGATVLILMAVVSPAAGAIIDRFGPRTVCSAGLAAIGAGLLLTSIGSADWQIFAFYGALIGLGSGAIAMPMVSAVVAHYFSTGQGLASGIGFSGATGGQLVALPALGLLVAALGWRGTFVSLGLTILVLAAAAWAVLRGWTPRETAGKTAGETAGETIGDSRAADPIRRRLSYLFGNATFWLLLGGFLVCGFTTAGVIEVHLIPYAAFCGFGPIESATAYGVHGGFNMAGVILAGALADRMHRPRMLAGIFFLRAILFVLLIHVGNDLPLLFLFAALYGFMNFATLPIIASIVAARLGVGVIGLALGLIFGVHWLGAAAGAFLGGRLYELFARYDELWLVSIASVIVAGFLMLLIPEDRANARPVPAPA